VFLGRMWAFIYVPCSLEVVFTADRVHSGVRKTGCRGAEVSSPGAEVTSQPVSCKAHRVSQVANACFWGWDPMMCVAYSAGCLHPLLRLCVVRHHAY
jgi:hypothetical protein